MGEKGEGSGGKGGGKWGMPTPLSTPSRLLHMTSYNEDCRKPIFTKSDTPW